MIKFKLKFVWWWGMAPMKMVRKVTGSGTTWTGFWIASGMDIDCAGRSKWMDRRWDNSRYNWCFWSSRRE